MTDAAESNPRIYVACLAAYNNGYLHGAWIDADQDTDEIRAEVAAMLLSCPLLSGPSTMTVWTKEGTTNACEEAQARGDYREAA